MNAKLDLLQLNVEHVPASSPLRYPALRGLSLLLAVLMFFWSVAPVLALPTGLSGGTTSGGGGDIGIHFEDSSRPIIEYASFDIADGEQVTIEGVPLGRSLHRVTGGGGASSIDGILSAADENIIYLINPNGILFGANANVNVGGLVASTLNIDDDDFLTTGSHLNFFYDNSVGSITVASGATIAAAKMAYFLGDSVSIKGTVNAADMVVGAFGNSTTDSMVLEAANGAQVTLDLSGLVSSGSGTEGRVDISGGQITGDGTTNALVNIIATADLLQTNGFVTNTAGIKMQSVENMLVHQLYAEAAPDASIILETLSGNLLLTNSGVIQASSNITMISGNNLTMNNGSSVSAGGDVDFHADGNLTLYPYATVTAGGDASLYAGENLTMSGNSGVRASSNIIMTAGSNLMVAVGAMVQASSNITMTATNELVLSANTAIRAGGAIALDSGALMELGGMIASTNGKVTADSGGNLVVRAGPITAGGDIDLISARVLQIQGGVNSIAATGNLTATSGLNMDLAGQKLSAGSNLVLTSGGDLTSLSGTEVLAGGDVTLTSGTNMTLNGTVTGSNVVLFSGNTLTLTNAGTITATNAALTATNNITLQPLTGVSGDLTVTSRVGSIFMTNVAGGLAVSGEYWAGSNIVFQTDGNMSFDAASSVTGSNVWLTAGGTLDMVGVENSLTATNAALTSGSSMTLGNLSGVASNLSVTSTAGDITILSNITVGGDADFYAANHLTVNTNVAISVGGALDITAMGADMGGYSLGMNNNSSLTAGNDVTLYGARSIQFRNVTSLYGSVKATNQATGMNVMQAFGNIWAGDEIDLNAGDYLGTGANAGDSLFASNNITLKSGNNLTLYAVTSVLGNVTASNAGGNRMQLNRAVTALSPTGTVELWATTNLQFVATASVSASNVWLTAAIGALLLTNDVNQITATNAWLTSRSNMTLGGFSGVSSNLYATSTVGSIIITNAITVGGDADFYAAQNLTNQAAVTAGGTLDMTAAGGQMIMNEAGSATADGDVTLKSGIAMTLSGITSYYGNVTTTNTTGMQQFTANVFAGGEIDAASGMQLNMGNGVALFASNDVTLRAVSNMTLYAVTSQLGKVSAATVNDLFLKAHISAGDTLDLAAGNELTFDTTGSVTAGSNVTFTSGAAMRLQAVTSVYGNVTASNASGGMTLSNRVAALGGGIDLAAAGSLTMAVGSSLFASNDITLESGNGMMLRGVTSQYSNVTATNNGPNLMMLYSSVSAEAGAIDLFSRGNLTAGLSGSVTASNDVTLHSGSDMTLYRVASETGDVAVEAHKIFINSNVTAGGSITLDAGMDVDMKTGGSLNAVSNVAVYAASNGYITLLAVTSQTANVTVTNEGGNIAIDGTVTAQAADSTVDMWAGGDLAFGADGFVAGSNVWLYATDALDMSGTANKLSATNAALTSGTDMTLAQITGVSSNLYVTSRLGNITFTEDITVGGSAVFDAATGMAAPGDVSLTATKGTMDIMSGGEFAADSNLTFHSFGNMTLDAVLNVANDLSATVVDTNKANAVMLTISSNTTSGGDTIFHSGYNMELGSNATNRAYGDFTASIEGRTMTFLGSNSLLKADGDIYLFGVAYSNDNTRSSHGMITNHGNIEAGGSFISTNGGFKMGTAGSHIQASNNISIFASGDTWVYDVSTVDGDIYLASDTAELVLRGDVKATNSSANGSTIELDAKMSVLSTNGSTVEATHLIATVHGVGYDFPEDSGNYDSIRLYNTDVETVVLEGNYHFSSAVMTNAGDLIVLGAQFSSNITIATRSGDLILAGDVTNKIMTSTNTGFINLTALDGDIIVSNGVKISSTETLDMTAFGDLTMQEGSALSASNNITLNSGTDMTLYGMASATGGIFATNSAGNMLLSSNITAAGDAIFTSASNLVVGDQMSVVVGGGLTMTAGHDLDMEVLDSMTAASNIVLAATNMMALGPLTSTTGNITGTAGHDITLYGGVSATNGIITFISGNDLGIADDGSVTASNIWLEAENELWMMGTNNKLTGTNATLISGAEMYLAQITGISSNLTVTSRLGHVTITNAIAVGGDADFHAGDQLVMNTGSSLTASNDVTLFSSNVMRLQAVTSWTGHVTASNASGAMTLSNRVAALNGEIGIAAAGGLTMVSGSSLFASNDITLESGNGMILRGVTSQVGNVTATNNGPNLMMLYSGVSAGAGAIDLFSKGNLTADGASLWAAQDVTLNSSNNMQLGDVTAQAGNVAATSTVGLVYVFSDVVAGDTIDLNAGKALYMHSAASLLATNDITLNSISNMTLNGGVTSLVGSVSMANTTGDIFLLGAVDAQGGDLRIAGDQLTVSNSLSAASNIVLELARQILVTGDMTATHGGISLVSTNDLVNLSGNVVAANGAITIQGDQIHTEGNYIIADQALVMQAAGSGGITRYGALEGQNITLLADGGNVTVASDITATDTVAIEAAGNVVLNGMRNRGYKAFGIRAGGNIVGNNQLIAYDLALEAIGAIFIHNMEVANDLFIKAGGIVDSTVTGKLLVKGLAGQYFIQAANDMDGIQIDGPAKRVYEMEKIFQRATVDGGFEDMVFGAKMSPPRPPEPGPGPTPGPTPPEPIDPTVIIMLPAVQHALAGISQDTPVLRDGLLPLDNLFFLDGNTPYPGVPTGRIIQYLKMRQGQIEQDEPLSSNKTYE